MQSYISQEAAKNPQPEVHISVDKFSKYEIVAQTLGLHFVTPMIGPILDQWSARPSRGA